jgi:hypothetical protein
MVVTMVLLFALGLARGVLRAEPAAMPPWEDQLAGLEGVYIDADIVGPDIAMMVTEEEIETEMRTRLWEAGVWVFEDLDDERNAPVLTLTFIAEPVEPVFPTDEGDMVRVYPIFIDLNLTEPVTGIKRMESEVTQTLVGQTWWTHVQAWAMERTMRHIACLAVKKALDQFIEDFEAARRPQGDSLVTG